MAILLAATRAAGEPPPASISTLTLPEWWAAAGRPGWTSDAAWMGGLPWTIAGLASGGWELFDPLAPACMPAPGIVEAQAPLAWYDSSAVTIGGGAAWRGFGAGLARAEGIYRPLAGRKPRAVWTYATGDAALDENGLFVSRGDERSWLRLGALGFVRGSIGDMGISGRHLWTFASGARRGRNLFTAGFAQRGLGERQRIGFGESANGQGGQLGWSYEGGGSRAALEISRALDRRTGYGADADFDLLRREGRQDHLEASLERTRGERGAGVQLRLDDARVRSEDFALDGSATRLQRRSGSAWLAARAHRPLGEGRLEIELGGGHVDSPARRAERWQFSPSASWRVGDDARSARLFGERLVDPMWSDLGPGLKPYVQDVWVGGFEAGAGAPASPAHGSVQLVAGRAAGRATLFRYPIREVALGYIGWRRDDEPYHFLLVTGEGRARLGPLSADASGYALARDPASSQRRVDPALGARGGLEGGFRVFAGDLGVRLRLGAAWIGERESETRTTIPDVRLAGYGTYSASSTITLGDATVEVRADGLENVRHPQTWVDPSQFPLVLARDSGRSYRVSMIWPFYN